MTLEEIDALADRIVTTFRAAADRYEEPTEDSLKILKRYGELKRTHDFAKSANIALTEWLRSVLAEAFK